MTEGGDFFGLKDDKLDYDLDNDGYNDDYDQQHLNMTQPFRPGASSTPYQPGAPYHDGESVEMKTTMHEQEGLPSYDEKTPLLETDFDELTRRFDELKKK